MARRCKRLIGFCMQLNTRYTSPYIPLSISVVPFSSLDVYPDYLNSQLYLNQTKAKSNIDERYVLGELSQLLQFSPKTKIENLYENIDSEKQIEKEQKVVVDAFISPEEKLRGVFLQKLKGKTAIENALNNVEVDLSIDVVAKVVNWGNLSGEKMIMLFNWAIKKPTIPKDIQSYHVILKALGRRNFFNFMMEILEQMRIQGINPNLDTMSMIMDSFIKARFVHKAIQMFGNLEEYGLTRDTESLNMLLKCLCGRSQVDAAYSFINSMNGKIQFDSTTYNIIISGWSKFGRVDKIERTLRAMVADGLNPDSSTYSYLIEGLGRSGRINGAAEVFNQMKENECIPDTIVYNAVIANFISVGDFDECMKYYKIMLSNECEPNLETYNKLICGFLKVRKVADALELFEEMLDRGVVPKTGTLTSFIKPLCSYGPPHAAMMIYSKARKVGCEISFTSYKLLLMRLSRFGKCGMLLNVWEEMQKSGYPCDIEAYEYVINGLCNIGQLENAVMVMEESLRKGFCPSRLMCSKLNNKLLASHKLDIAYRLFLKIKAARRNENARRYWRANGWHF